MLPLVLVPLGVLRLSPLLHCWARKSAPRLCFRANHDASPMFQMDLPYRSPMENDWLWDSPCYLVAAVCSLQAGNPVIVLRIFSFDSDSTRHCPWFDRIGGSTRHVRSSFTFVIAADPVCLLYNYTCNILVQNALNGSVLALGYLSPIVTGFRYVNLQDSPSGALEVTFTASVTSHAADAADNKWNDGVH